MPHPGSCQACQGAGSDGGSHIWESIRPAYSPENAIIFEKRILEEESVTDICEELDIDRAKVDRTVHRIIKKIKEEISKENYSKELQ